jgi:hypothetical protein
LLGVGPAAAGVLPGVRQTESSGKSR